MLNVFILSTRLLFPEAFLPLQVVGAADSAASVGTAQVHSWYGRVSTLSPAQ